MGEYEDNCSRFLRETVVRMIKFVKINIPDKEYYDDEHYTSSIDDRINKMVNEGVFGGKLEMDIISKMYKIKISVFIKFNGEYSSIYRSSLDKPKMMLKIKLNRLSIQILKIILFNW